MAIENAVRPTIKFANQVRLCVGYIALFDRQKTPFSQWIKFNTYLIRKIQLSSDQKRWCKTASKEDDKILEMIKLKNE